MMRGEKPVKNYLTAVSFLLIIGCADKFPVDHIINIDQSKKVCDRYLLDQASFKFKFDKAIPYNQCLNIYGFEAEDVGKIMAWIRRNQKKLQDCAIKTNNQDD